MAPHLVGTHRDIGADVEASSQIAGPREPVRDVLDAVGQILAALEISEAQRVALAAVHVGRIHQETMIGRHLEPAEREIVVTAGECVLVEQHLLGAARAGAPAMDDVLLALDRAGEVLPRPVGHRRGLVGLLDAAADLAVDAVA